MCRMTGMANHHLNSTATRFPTMEAVARFARELLRHDVVNVNYWKSHESLNKYTPKCASNWYALCLFFSYFSLLIAF